MQRFTTNFSDVRKFAPTFGESPIVSLPKECGCSTPAAAPVKMGFTTRNEASG